MNVNVIDNQLLESLNNYFDTLSKLGYIKNSNSEALLVLSFLQEITSDYTDLVTFLNSLSENYCIIPFLDLSTCKVDLNSSDQLVRFTANLDDVSAYINTSYLNNQLINFPYMAITGKSIQINAILAPDLNNSVTSIFKDTSKYFMSTLEIDGTTLSTFIFKEPHFRELITIDHEVDSHTINVDLKTLPEYKLNVIYNHVDDPNSNPIDIDLSTSIKTLCVGYFNNGLFDRANIGSIDVSTKDTYRIVQSVRTALTPEGHYSYDYATGTLVTNDTVELPSNLIYVVGSLWTLENLFNTELIEHFDYTYSTKYRFPVFLYNDPNEVIATNTAMGKLPVLPDSSINAYTCNYKPSSYLLDNSFCLIPKEDYGSNLRLQDISWGENGFEIGSNYIGLEYNTDSVLVLAQNISDLIIPTSREDGSAEDIIADGLALGPFYTNNEKFTYVCHNLYGNIYALANVTQKNKDTLLWCGKAFAGSVFAQEFRSPEGTTLTLTDVKVMGHDNAEAEEVNCEISTSSGPSNVTSVTITLTTNTAFSKIYQLKIGGHIQYNTTTVDITGNISNMRVHIEGEGTVSLPASITVNRP